jgi:hypothetical protein
VRAGINFPIDQIAEVVSHDHILLQCLDLVLGAMSFRLNDKHTIKPADAHRRGKRTIAKERVYRAINQRLQQLRPHFNVGVSTGLDDEPRNHWNHSYRHWLFVPRNRIIDTSRTKRKTP